MYKNTKYLIACSGGPDSMALLDMYLKKGFYLEVAHVNYHKRSSALNDQKIVEEYCLNNNLKFHLLDYSPLKQKGNFQKNARIARYAFFKEVCLENNLDAVLVAHHKDDLLETYLMQKNKNIGVDYYGLRKQIYIDDLLVIRPLLSYQKSDLVKYCLNNNLKYGVDESNLSNDYTRNKIRHEFIEKMSLKEKNNLIKEINNLNKAKQEEYKIAKKFFNFKELEVNEFLSIPYLKSYLRNIVDNKSDKYLNEVLRQLKEADKVIFEFKDNILLKEYGKIAIYKKPSNYEFVFNDIDDIKFKKYAYFKIAKKDLNVNKVVLKKEDFPVKIRNVRSKDYILMSYGKKKLNRFFIDKKIKYYDRLIYPVVVNKFDEVIMVPGLGCDIYHYAINEGIFVIKL